MKVLLPSRHAGFLARKATDTELEKWLDRSRFGKRERTDSKSAFKNLTDEMLGLAFFRRKVQLPSRWWPLPTHEPNPYPVLPPQAEDSALRRKAAPLVALWLLATVGSGCAFWGWLAWLVVHSG